MGPNAERNLRFLSSDNELSPFDSIKKNHQIKFFPHENTTFSYIMFYIENIKKKYFNARMKRNNQIEWQWWMFVFILTIRSHKTPTVTVWDELKQMTKDI